MTNAEQVRAWLEEALHDPAPLYDLQDVLRDVEANHAQLWAGDRSCMVTSIDDYPNGERVLRVWLCAGELDHVMEGRVQVEEWAKQAGCTQIIIEGRPGWVRALKEHGFEHYATQVRKILK